MGDFLDLGDFSSLIYIWETFTFGRLFIYIYHGRLLLITPLMGDFSFALTLLGDFWIWETFQLH